MNLTRVAYIVDDDDAVRDSFQILLEMLGIPIRAFASAEEFLAAWEPNWNGLVFIDLRMPGMGGFKMIEELERLGSRLAVAIISGHLDEERISESSGSYPATILEKPFEVERLKDVLRRYFDVPGLARTETNSEDGRQESYSPVDE